MRERTEASTAENVELSYGIGILELRRRGVGILMAAVLSACGGADREPAITPDDTIQAASASGIDSLRDEAERIVAFLRGEASLDSALLADSVTLYIAPEGGGAERRVARQALEDREAWRVDRHALAPPEGLTEVTMRDGRHFNCMEYPLESRYPHLAQRPHIGVKLTKPDSASCLQTWNLTLVFTEGPARPRLTAVVYDRWEW